MKHTATQKENSPRISRIIRTLIGGLLCLILIPILLMNLTLICKSYLDPDTVPEIGGYCPLIVLTGSMEPQINSGDLIFVKSADSTTICEGDVIAFFDPDSSGNSILTHRVTEVVTENGALAFRTKGDANDSQDLSLVPAENLVGIYKKRIPGAGSVAMFLQTTTGLVVCVVVPLLLIVVVDMLHRHQLDKRQKQDKAALAAELEALRQHPPVTPES